METLQDCSKFTGTKSVAVTQRRATKSQKKDPGPAVKSGLKKNIFFFSSGQYVGHMGTVKKGEFIFPKSSFWRALRAGWSRRGRTGHRNGVYLSYTFPRSAAFKAGIGQSDFLTRD